MQADGRQRDGAAARPVVHRDDYRRRPQRVHLRFGHRFLSPGTFLLALGGTNSGGDGSVTGRGSGGTTNTQLQFSGANLLAALGPFTAGAFSGSASGPFSPTAIPYSLTIGMAISRTTAGSSTGDLNLQVSAVPEPSTWALMLMGPALIGFVVQRRRRRGG